MKKFDYRKVLVSGKEYECACTKNGRVHLIYVQNGTKHLYAFEDTMNEVFISKASFYVTGQIIVEVVAINYVDLGTGYVSFTGRVKFGNVINNK